MTIHVAAGPLDEGTAQLDQWRLLQTPAGAYASPGEISESADWIEARAPGTVAAALEAAGRFDRAAPDDLDAHDHWYRADVAASGSIRLTFHGLATLAEVFVDGVRVATSQSMFTPLQIEALARGRVRVDILFRAMGPWLARRRPRARWRPRAVQPAAIRNIRSTLIGRMPGWCPAVRAVGPWRRIEMRDARATPLRVERVSTRVDGGEGVLEMTLAAGAGVRIACGGVGVDVPAAPLARSVTLRLPDVALWHPHTHGAPTLHDVTARIDGRSIPLGRVGFRTIACDRGADGRGFGLVVNGAPVFCRGANWISADIVTLHATRERYRAQLGLARDAGMNMIRCPGSTVYEHEAFYETCDELGLLVWQDFMFANLDYPDDPEFCAAANAEAEAFLERTQWSPSLAVFCGGAEIAQQAAMLGLPGAAWRHPVFDAVLPRAVAARRADAIYVAHTPEGGDLPFVTDEGLCHYFGVSAHRRGFDDIRRAQVRFAPECLGFSHVPAHDPPLQAERAAVAQPTHGETAEIDSGAVWYIEDVRNHYTAQLYGVPCAALRGEAPSRYLDLARATTGEVASELFGEWRSAGSPTRGGLVLFFQDVEAPGAGWGLLDHRGAPKPVWHALRRAFQPVTVTMTDEGLNGAKITLINETGCAREVDLTFACLRDGAIVVASASRRLTLAPQSVSATTSSQLLGAFFDVTNAYCFSQASHDVVVAQLVDPQRGETLAQACLFPGGRGAARVDTGVRARLVEDEDGWHALVTANRFAQNVRLTFEGHWALDNWFHLAPRATIRTALRPTRADAGAPRGLVTALNDAATFEVMR